MLYGDEGFEEDSFELENWEDELEFIGVESMYPFYGILFCSRLYIKSKYVTSKDSLPHDIERLWGEMT